MATVYKFENKLESHAIHVGQGQHRYHAVAAMHLFAKHLDGKLVIRPQCAEGQHHAFRVRCGAAGVVDKRQSVGVGGMCIADVFLSEIFGIFAAKQFVKPFACISQQFGARQEYRVVGNVDNALKMRHGLCVEFGPNHIAHKENLCLRVVNNVVHLLRLKFMQNRHRHCTIRQCGQKGCSPVGTIAAAQGNFVTLGNTCIFKQDMEFLNFSCYVLVLQGHTLIVG